MEKQEKGDSIKSEKQATKGTDGVSSKVKKREKDRAVERVIVSPAMEYVLAATVIAMCAAVSFYAKDGYNQIGNAKFMAYRVTMTIGFSIFLVLGIVWMVDFLLRREKVRLSLTDGFVLAWLFFSTAAVASGGFYEDALWGAFGWNMGWMSQFSFAFLYFSLSRFGRHWRVMLAAFCGLAAAVFGLEILHRMLIDPIGFYDGLTGIQKAQFLSTLGQATWYASYLAVALPVGLGVFLFSEKGLWRLLSGLYIALGFGTLVTQNSDSAYFALTGFLLVYFLICVERRETLNRFVEVCTLFFAVGKMMSFLMRLRPNPDLEYDFVTDLMLNGKSTWALLALCVALDLVLSQRRNRPYAAAGAKWAKRAVLGVTAAVLLTVTGLLILQRKGLLPGGISEAIEGISYLQWNDAWGNNRGWIWRLSGRMFLEGSLPHQLFGVGPDCFGAYGAAAYGEEIHSLWGSTMLTNAHNEWLTALVNIGVFGAVSYLGIFVTAIRRFWAGRRQAWILAVVTASIVSYMAYNFFCYQQVCCTPFVFMLLGMGEWVKREKAPFPAPKG